MATEASQAVVSHPSVAERTARGRAARKAVPRRALGAWESPPGRRPPVEILAEQEATRVPELVHVRHERMLVSPFTFYRGAAAVMAADLAATPSTDLIVQSCGDAHLANFGGFAAPDRHMVFDLNDFDETSRGPFEWDVQRLCASFEIAARANGFATGDATSIARQAATSYRKSMREFAGMGNLDVWYARLDVDIILARWGDRVDDKRFARFRSVVEKAKTKDSARALRRLTEQVDGGTRIAEDPPLTVRFDSIVGEVGREEVERWVRERFRIYRHSLLPDRRHLLEEYRLVDVARRVVGVGSVGTRCYIVLLLGRDHADPLFLQVKEAQASVLEPFAGRSEYANHGQRVVEGQRLVQAASDVLLGWFRAHSPDDGVERDFYVRQFWDGKLSPDIEGMDETAMTVFAEMCGWTLARAHARSGDRVAIAAYLGGSDGFDRALGDFAVAYADQNERDHASVAAALGAPAA